MKEYEGPYWTKNMVFVFGVTARERLQAIAHDLERTFTIVDD